MRNCYGGYTYTPEEPLEVLVENIKRLSFDGEFLLAMCNNILKGHAVWEHLDGKAPSRAPYFPTMEKNMYLDDSLPSDVQLSDDAIESEINRIVQQGLNSSHFQHYEDMAYALHIALYEHAEEIADWVNRTRFYGRKEINGRDDATMEVLFDMNKFVGSGITREGNQYVTSGVTVVFSNFTSSPGFDDTIPFTLTTIYPDISEKCKGSLYCTGKRFDDKIAFKVDRLPEDNAKLYWVLRAHGYDPKFIQANNNRGECIRVYDNTSVKYKSDGAPVQCRLDMRYDAYDSKLSVIEYMLRRDGTPIKMVRNPESEQARAVTTNPKMYEKIHNAIWDVERGCRDKWYRYERLYSQTIEGAAINLFPKDDKGVIFGRECYPGVGQDENILGDENIE